jgi:putative hydrolase of the HAD superfamily
MSGRRNTVILDFGGVLGLPQSPADAGSMAAMCGLSPEAFAAAYRRHRLELDRGSLSVEAYWSGIMEEGGITASAELLARANDLDTRSWTALNGRMIDWSRRLREAGTRTAILSNMPPDKVAFMRARAGFRWMAEFTAVVFSSDVNMVKPEPGIYLLCLERLGVQPEECLFIDDHYVNVDAAASLGIAGVLFTSCLSLARALSDWPEIPTDGLL